MQPVIEFTGGEDVALARLKHYLWDTDAIATYFDTRNGMLLADQSTKFSPALALGCLSPRLIYQARGLGLTRGPKLSSNTSPVFAWGCLSPRLIHQERGVVGLRPAA